MKVFKKELLKDWWNKNLDYFPLGARWRGKWQKGRATSIIREIDERILDIEIAQKVFGFKVKVGERTEYLDYGGDVEYPELQMCIKVHKNGSWDGERDWEEYEPLPNYSTDLKDAWKIIDKFNGFYTGESSPVKHYWTFPTEDNEGRPYWVGAEGDTVELAICLAALKASE